MFNWPALVMFVPLAVALVGIGGLYVGKRYKVKSRMMRVLGAAKPTRKQRHLNTIKLPRHRMKRAG